MKKYILTLLFAGAAMAAGAKTASELRVYINPGHGSWTSNDRPMQLIDHSAYSSSNVDTLGFFETNTNLEKGFGVLEGLVKCGVPFDRTLNQTGNVATTGAARSMSNNIVMSRVKNGPYPISGSGISSTAFNRSLTEIAAEVRANNFDMFISIHSDGATDGTNTNRATFLYRGYTTPTAGGTNLTLTLQKTSRAMAQKCWPYIFSNEHMPWTGSYSLTNPNICGDLTFYNKTASGTYPGYLGALKHNVPGFLVEGYFHTYQPARQRAMNWDVCRIEGYAYAHGIADYFGLTKESTGTIYGIVRDANEKFTHAQYKPNTSSDDVYKPLNGVDVFLKKNGSVVASYTTDNYWNGVFVFDRVEPGDYTVEFSADGYAGPAPISVTAKAAETVYCKAFLQPGEYEAPVKYYNDPYDGDASAFAVDKYIVEEVYADEPIAGLEGKVVRRAIVKDGRMYVLALDKELPEIASKQGPLTGDAKPQASVYVYDLDQKTLVGELSTEGMHGAFLDASDLQLTADGYLLACNMTLTQSTDAGQVLETDEDYPNRGTFKIYKWDNDENGFPTADPSVWIETQATGDMYRSRPGRFGYTGTSTKGTAMVIQPSDAGNNAIRMTLVKVSNGLKVSESEIKAPVATAGNATVAVYAASLGDYVVTTSPLLEEHAYLQASNGYAGEMKYNYSSLETFVSNNNDAMGASTGTPHGGAMRFSGASFLALPDAESGLKLFNINSGISGATAVQVLGQTITAAPDAVGCESRAELDSDGNTTGGYFNLYTLKNGKVTKLTTRNVEQGVTRYEYAYNLSSSTSGDDCVLNFDLTGDAEDVTVSFYNPDYDLGIEYPQGAMTKGSHQVTVDLRKFPSDQEYGWKVIVTSRGNVAAGEISHISSGLSVRGGVVPMTDPEYPGSFGKVVVAHGKVEGFDIYEADGTQTGERLHYHSSSIASAFTNQSDPFRGSEYRNYAVFPCWGDKSEGVVAIDAANPGNDPFGLYAGTNNGTGCHVLDGVKLGGGSAGACLVDQTDGTYLYSFSEDHEGSNGKGSTENSVGRWLLNDSMLATTAPEIVIPNTLLSNGQADLHPFGNKGFFFCQRIAAGEDAAEAPVFGFYSVEEGAVTFNSGATMPIAEGGNAFAINREGTLAVVGVNEAAKMKVYDVTWEGNTPIFSHAYDFDSCVVNIYTHLRFDFAGNLHAYRPSDGYYVYALPKAQSVVSTPAASLYTVTGKGIHTIVDEIETGQSSEAVYHNLSGVRVDSRNLAPGVYLKTWNGKTEKIIVR